jgi:hypothetical protein
MKRELWWQATPGNQRAKKAVDWNQAAAKNFGKQKWAAWVAVSTRDPGGTETGIQPDALCLRWESELRKNQHETELQTRSGPKELPPLKKTKAELARNVKTEKMPSAARDEELNPSQNRERWTKY